MMKLDTRLRQAIRSLQISAEQEMDLRVFLNLLRVKGSAGEATYEHCIKVGLLAKRIGSFMGMDAKALFYAGLLHDVGKSLTNPDTLSKTESWTPEDSQEMESHVLDGFRLLRGKFDFSAQILAYHHQFQRNCYPVALPAKLHPFSKGTEVTIAMYGRILSIADTYDALHRVNFQDGKVRKLSGAEIKEKMLKNNPDQKVLIENLYKSRILGRRREPCMRAL